MFKNDFKYKKSDWDFKTCDKTYQALILSQHP